MSTCSCLVLSQLPTDSVRYSLYLSWLEVQMQQTSQIKCLPRWAIDSTFKWQSHTPPILHYQAPITNSNLTTLHIMPNKTDSSNIWDCTFKELDTTDSRPTTPETLPQSTDEHRRPLTTSREEKSGQLSYNEHTDVQKITWENEVPSL